MLKSSFLLNGISLFCFDAVELLSTFGLEFSKVNLRDLLEEVWEEFDGVILGLVLWVIESVAGCL